MEVRDQMSMPDQLWTAYTQPVGFRVSMWSVCVLGIGMNSKPYIHPSSTASQCQLDSPCTPESYIRTCASVCEQLLQPPAGKVTIHQLISPSVFLSVCSPSLPLFLSVHVCVSLQFHRNQSSCLLCSSQCPPTVFSLSDKQALMESADLHIFCSDFRGSSAEFCTCSLLVDA